MQRLLMVLIAVLAVSLSANGQTNEYYYLRNVGTGKWLGPGNAWGTQASMTDVAQWVKLQDVNNGYAAISANVLPSGTYRLQSQVKNGDANQYLGIDGNYFMDTSAANAVNLTISRNGSNSYSIQNAATGELYVANGNLLGTSSAASYKWRIRSYDQMVESLKSATQANPVDASFLILDNGFSLKNIDQSAWSIANTGGSTNLSGGENWNKCAEAIHGTFTLSQTINNIPNGIYELSAQGFYRQDGTDNEHLPVIYAKDGENGAEAQSTFNLRTGTENNMNAASKSFRDGNYPIEPVRITVTNNSITVGAKLEENTNLWCIWDNFSLKYLGDGGNGYGTYTSSGSPATISGANSSKYYIEYVGDGNYTDGLKWLVSGGDYGTHAALQEHPQYVLLTKTANGYTVKTQQTGTNNNLGSNSNNDPRYVYTDCPDSRLLTFTLAPVSGEADTYYLSSNGTFYTRSSGTDGAGYYYMLGTNDTKWEILSHTQMLQEISDATETKPEDATFLIGDYSFGRNNVDIGKWSMAASNQNLSGGDPTNHCAESYHSTFTLSQTLTGIPNGVYELTAQGFYRQEGSDNEHLPYFYADGSTRETQSFNAISGSENSMADASASFTSGNYTISPIRVLVKNHTLTIGAALEDNTNLWAIWDNFTLSYKGDPFLEPLQENAYYLRNVAAPSLAPSYNMPQGTGDWLMAGNLFGTRASLQKHPQYVIIHPNGSKYRIETQNNKNGTYLGFWDNDLVNPMMNSAVTDFNITPTGDGYYTISYNNANFYGYDPSRTVADENPNRVYPVTNGVDNIKWELLTHEQMIEKMLDGTLTPASTITQGGKTYTNPQDATFLIKDFDFGRYNKFEGKRTGRKTLGPAVPAEDPSVGHVNQNMEAYETTFNAYQELVGIPNGKYIVRAQAAVVFHDNRVVKEAGNGGYPLIYASTEITNAPTGVPFRNMEGGDILSSQTQMANSFNAGNYWTDWVEVEVVSGRLYVGAWSNRRDIWAVWDNFEMYYVGELDPETETSPTYYANATTKDLWVLPRQSFLADRADELSAQGIDYPAGFLQGGEGWKAMEFDGQTFRQVPGNGQVQNVSEYTTIHYVKKGEWSPLFLTTNNGTTSTRHTYYQRWYYYDKDSGMEKPMDTEMFAPEYNAYLYQNGLVMGGQLHNGTNNYGGTNPIGYAFLVNFPKSMPGDELIVGGDISRYSDMSYATPGVNNAQAAGDLTEASLTMRHIYKIRDAKQMAMELTGMKSTSNTDENWLEEHVIHFPSRTIGVRADHVPLDLELRDYWFYISGNANSNNDDDLQNISSDKFLSLEVYYPDGTNLGMRNVQMVDAPNTNKAVSTGFQPYTIQNTTKLRRRLIKFDYPNSKEFPGDSKAQILVRAFNPNTNEYYNLARFTLIFDRDSETLPYMDIIGDDAPKKERWSKYMRQMVGGIDPVAHISFDFPKDQYFKTPTEGNINYNGKANPGTSDASSALPYSFQSTSYAYSLVQTNELWYSEWGDYAIGKLTQNNEGGNIGILKARPVSELTGDMVNKDLEAGFLFVDASDLPGTLATIPFEGSMCKGSKLMCTGWMASRTNNVPGSVILKIFGNDGGIEEEVYAFCPGEIGLQYRRYGTNNLVNPAANTEYCWQQFYFDFVVTKKYDSYVLRVENNCKSTTGGDYFIDDIWVFAEVPTLAGDRTSPLCGGSLELVQLEIDYGSLLASSGLYNVENESQKDPNHHWMSFIYLDWDIFLNEFHNSLIDEFNESYSKAELEEKIRIGYFDNTDYDDIYKQAFAASVMKKAGTDEVAAGQFEWHNYYDGYPEYSFSALASDETRHQIFRYGDGDNRRLVFNGALGDEIEGLKFFNNYALLTDINSFGSKPNIANMSMDRLVDLFNLRSTCSSRSYFYFTPKTQILGTLVASSIDEIEFCRHTTRTFAMELTGIDYEHGEDVAVEEVYFDWWLGDPSTTPITYATLENYETQHTTINGQQIYLKEALRNFRLLNPNVTNINSSSIKVGDNPSYPGHEFTAEMLQYIRSLASPADGSKPQLVLHTKIVDIEVSDDMIETETNVGESTDYVKFVAIPIEARIDEAAHEHTYYCLEPLPFKIKVLGSAPTVREGFSDKTYPINLGTLSVRIAKSQFEKVRDHGDGVYSLLHVPLRGVHVETEGAIGVRKLGTPEADVVLLANTTDSIMYDYILQGMENLLPPKVGTIDYLEGLTKEDYTYEERLAKIHFSKDFLVREGYSYTLRMYFTELFADPSASSLQCEGTVDLVIKIVPYYEVWTGSAENTEWSNDENWRRADYDELYAGNGMTLKNTATETKYMTNDVNYVNDRDRERRQGFAPLYCTNILMMTTETAPAPILYDDGDEVDGSGNKTGFPALRETSSPMIRYDFQCHEWNDEIADLPENAGKVAADGDMVTELYNTNVCGKIAFQPETELVNSHYLNYEKAWVEYSLKKNQWHLLGSPLKDMLSGEWYAPTYSARQETTYFEDIQFDTPPTIDGTTYRYDRFAPAVYQRAWDKAKAVLYERGATWSAADGDQDDPNTGSAGEGHWGTDDPEHPERDYEWWEGEQNADSYLQRLTYKPMGNSKANVAVKGTWSGVYNDHTVPFSGSGFSVMPINNLKGGLDTPNTDTPWGHNDDSVPTLFRLPKDDYYYDIWDWTKKYQVSARVRVFVEDGREWPASITGKTAENTVSLPNRGRLRSDELAPSTSATEYTVTLKNEGKGGVGFFLVANPFISGLDMEKFFTENATVVEPYYLTLTNEEDAALPDATLTDDYVTKYNRSWTWTDMGFRGIKDSNNEFQGKNIIPARYAFFVKSLNPTTNELTLKFTTDMMTTGREVPAPSPEPSPAPRRHLSIYAERDGNWSEARVEVGDDASNLFKEAEDLETFVVDQISSDIPVVYTLTGRLATSINRLHDFKVLPIGIESNSTEPAILTFEGVENVGEGLQLYDAFLQTLTPLKSGVKVRVPGSTQNRFFIVTEMTESAKAECDIQIQPHAVGAKVISTSGEPLTHVWVYDMGGRLIFEDNPGFADYTIELQKGVYVIKATNGESQNTKKIMVR